MDFEEITFSSHYTEKVAFTRDYSQIKVALDNIEEADKTHIATGLFGANKTILEEWGNNMSCHIILVTDGSPGVDGVGTQDLMNSMHAQSALQFPFPFSYPAKLHVVCITSSNDPVFSKYKHQYQRLIEMAGHGGSLLVPDGPLSDTTMNALFQKLAEESYVAYNGTLKCGDLESKIYLSPAPVQYTKQSDFRNETFTMSDTLEVCGFIAVSDIGSPMAVSRHLILPATALTTDKSAANQIKSEPDATPIVKEDDADDGKTPSFCVLLHGALKVENVAALVEVAENWYGFVYSWADSKKKSNLMLTVLVPGADAVPWLGNLNNLHCTDDVLLDDVITFPIKPAEKRSYSLNGVVWIRQTGLQSDIQKILRHARKLPDKTQQFYKELNRLRKAAVQLGFLDLLTHLAGIFEQECTQLPGTAHPDCAFQLTHAADSLRKTINRDVKHVITPYQTKYST